MPSPGLCASHSETGTEGCTHEDSFLAGRCWLNDLDPYHKMRLGWVRPRVRTIADSGTVTLQSGFVSSSAAISNESPIFAYDPSLGMHQYFLLEHRSQLGYDATVVGRGVAVWHSLTDTSHNPAVMTSGIAQRGVYTINPKMWSIENSLVSSPYILSPSERGARPTDAASGW